MMDISTKMQEYLGEMEMYGYTSTGEYAAALEDAQSIAAVKYMYPSIGKDYYTEICNKDVNNLTTNEYYIYWAIVCLSISMFLNLVANKEQQSLPSTQSSQGKKGTSKSVSGRIGKAAAAGWWYNEGVTSMYCAGYVKSSTICREGIETMWRGIDAD